MTAEVAARDLQCIKKIVLLVIRLVVEVQSANLSFVVHFVFIQCSLSLT
jgi:hypothetical protein